MPRFRRSSSLAYSAALITMCLLVTACGDGDRYDIVVSGGEAGVAYRLDKRTGEVIEIRGGKGWRVLPPESPAPEEFATADLRDVQIVGLEKDGIGGYYANLYNGTAIEFSEVTFRIRTRLYRTRVNIQPFAAGYAVISIMPDDTPPGKVVIVSARGIRRDT